MATWPIAHVLAAQAHAEAEEVTTKLRQGGKAHHARIQNRSLQLFAWQSGRLGWPEPGYGQVHALANSFMCLAQYFMEQRSTSLPGHVSVPRNLPLCHASYGRGVRRSEYEEENQEARSRAAWQLQALEIKRVLWLLCVF